MNEVDQVAPIAIAQLARKLHVVGDGNCEVRSSDFKTAPVYPIGRNMRLWYIGWIHGKVASPFVWVAGQTAGTPVSPNAGKRSWLRSERIVIGGCTLEWPLGVKECPIIDRGHGDVVEHGGE